MSMKPRRRTRGYRCPRYDNPLMMHCYRCETTYAPHNTRCPECKWAGIHTKL